MFEWKPLETPPEKTGKYLLGHRGTVIIETFYAPSAQVTKTGWQSDPRKFAATHWCEIEYPESTEKRKHFPIFAKGQLVRIQYDADCKVLSQVRKIEDHDRSKPSIFNLWRKVYTDYRVYRYIRVHAGEIGFVTGVESRKGNLVVHVSLNGKDVEFDETVGYPIEIFERM